MSNAGRRRSKYIECHATHRFHHHGLPPRRTEVIERQRGRQDKGPAIFTHSISSHSSHFRGTLERIRIEKDASLRAVLGIPLIHQFHILRCKMIWTEDEVPTLGEGDRAGQLKLLNTIHLERQR
ncbi:uncharacterized protein MYCFIDRAFT_174384 [Pseudocercospora fijiensis CIRAD86]|uniref:Uncharacterized protein n=1 Tax=Pseudocercospora fijiensis (strain CIRAD86) TaxID=383855 RepID=M3B0B9_PSEFD|nr:uncharacterized protein MYCFIDRAFT_174384 [Pseudocercospora fijiensis CIRAD86]EME82858.1 hypothetical protein MYCFIDRAFT_174384 [Pseudocercospora fijiensis CIRAD86]